MIIFKNKYNALKAENEKLEKQILELKNKFEMFVFESKNPQKFKVGFENNKCIITNSFIMKIPEFKNFFHHEYCKYIRNYTVFDKIKKSVVIISESDFEKTDYELMRESEKLPSFSKEESEIT